MRVVSIILIVLLACGAAAAQCPADKAQAKGEKGVSPFGSFHEIMAPAWHEAYPAKNFEAMFKAAPEFETRFVAVKEMKPAFKHEARKAAFDKNRAEFGDLVTVYAMAAAKQDSTTVYDLLPKLHNAFESSAQCLLPVEFPQVDGMLVTVLLINDKHLPENNMEGIAGSTETLVTKATALDEASIPKECETEKAAMLKDLQAIKETIGKLKAACDKKDMASYKEHLATLRTALKAIGSSYLEA